MDKSLPIAEIISRLQTKYPKKVEAVSESIQPAVKVGIDAFFSVVRDLKDEFQLNFLADLTAVDLEESFAGIYHVMSWEPYQVLRVMVNIPKETARVPSLVDLWPAATVQEREAYDMLGIVYEGHPNLSRIFLSEDFKGHPLQKNFKLESRR